MGTGGGGGCSEIIFETGPGWILFWSLFEKECFRPCFSSPRLPLGVLIGSAPSADSRQNCGEALQTGQSCFRGCFRDRPSFLSSPDFWAATAVLTSFNDCIKNMLSGSLSFVRLVHCILELLQSQSPPASPPSFQRLFQTLFHRLHKHGARFWIQLKEHTRTKKTGGRLAAVLELAGEQSLRGQDNSSGARRRLENFARFRSASVLRLAGPTREPGAPKQCDAAEKSRAQRSKKIWPQFGPSVFQVHIGRLDSSIADCRILDEGEGCCNLRAISCW